MFDSHTGSYMFTSSDSVTYPPGEYMFGIFGVIGEPIFDARGNLMNVVFAGTPFTMTLVASNICDTTTV